MQQAFLKGDSSNIVQPLTRYRLAMRRAVPLLLLRYSYLVGCGGQFREHLFEVSFKFCWP